ncbi:MAG: FIVAR domain-containing protein [Clostridia bacterium]|nr:FIVAR domain-containing protein [Clostridia bacterium]
MKLTKRLLAIVLAAAMLVGMVVFSSSAVQLDDAVASLTWEDCENINPETNPYTVRIGFKVYEIDTASGEYSLIADSNTANDVYDVNVTPGSVLRVEMWAQTNFHTLGIQLTPAYTNTWLLPTKMTDYSTFAIKAAKPADKLSVDDGMPAVENFDDSYGAGDGTFEAPVYSNEALAVLKGQTNHNSYSGLKAILPASWKGTGTTAANWFSKTATDQWGNSIVDADGNFKYNVYQFGCGNTVGAPQAWLGYATILNVYQPICAFNLTVADDATGSANLFFPDGTYENVASPMTYFQAVDYDEVIASPDAKGNWDPSMPQVCSSGLTTYKNTVTYSDGTVADKKWIVENAVLTVDDGTGGEDETTTEPPTTEAPVEYADLAALQAAIAKAATADKTNCTSASVAEFEAALAAANALNVEGTLKSEQDAVDAAATRLENAITGLTKLGACNYAELDAAIAAYEAKVADSYKYANWADYTALYEAAKAVTRDMIADEAGANQKVIDDAAAALNNFALVEKTVDYAAWNAAVAKVPADLSAYTPASVAAYETAKAAAEAAKDAAVAAYDQAALDQAAADLEAAIALLAPKADKAALQAAITRASALDADDYTPDSWAAADLATVLAAANEVNADPNATAAAVADAVAAIEAAEAKLVVKADKGALADAIAAAKAIDAAEYTPDSWSLAGLENAIGSAETVYNDGNATAEAVAGAIAALEAAAAKLVKLADKAALKAAIDTLPAVTEDKAIAATWEAYEAELAEANAVYADANATQGAVDAAEAELLAAIAGVKALGNCDYTVLDEAIAAYEAKLADKDLYENWAAYEAAYDAAKAVARDMIADEAGANQKAIDDAAAALNAVVLTYKAADYAAVEAAIATIPADLNDGKYTAASVKAVEDAVAAVVYGLDITKQAEVNAAAAAIANAVAALAPLGACDYAALDAAIAAYEAKVADKDLYANWADYEAAYNAAKAVARDMIADEDGVNQTIINDAEEALTAVVLEYKAADYSAVDAAKDAAAAIDATKYTSASVKAVNDAVAAVVEGYDITKQAEVDAMAKAINDAIAALVDLEACDYAALDAALALVPAEAEDAYTALTWKAYAEAKADAEAIARDLLADEAGVNQANVDAAAAALVDAYNALKINVANITSVDYDSEGVFAQASLAYAFKVNGAPSKIQVITAGGSTMTFDRRSTKVSLVSYNEAGEVVDYANEDPAYEIWTINLALKAGDYTVKAKYGYVWDTEAYAFAVEYDEYEAEAEAFTASVGEYVDATEVTAAKGETITFKAITDTTVTKIQMVLAGGSTSTYTTSKAVNNGDGTLTWTITRTFTKSQDINLKVKTPSGWGTESVGNVKVTIG